MELIKLKVYTVYQLIDKTVQLNFEPQVGYYIALIQFAAYLPSCIIML